MKLWPTVSTVIVDYARRGPSDCRNQKHLSNKRGLAKGEEFADNVA